MVERLRGIFLTCRLRRKGYWCRFGDRGGQARHTSGEISCFEEWPVQIQSCEPSTGGIA